MHGMGEKVPPQLFGPRVESREVRKPWISAAESGLFLQTCFELICTSCGSDRSVTKVECL